MPNLRQFCTFHVDSLFLGVEVEKVQEIIRQQPITRVPKSSYVVRGLINLRGQIVTAIDLRRRMQIPDRPDGHALMNVVLATDEGKVSLLVDRVGDVLHVDEDIFERPPETMTSATRELIRGAYKLDNRLMLALETDKVVQLDR
jgi:purine-binding chemotaxis protein CheW